MSIKKLDVREELIASRKRIGTCDSHTTVDEYLNNESKFSGAAYIVEKLWDEATQTVQERFDRMIELMNDLPVDEEGNIIL